MRRAVFGLGMAQVLITIAVTMAGGWLLAQFAPQILNLSWQASFAIGGALAMSSTAIVSKMLTERMELESEQGRQIMSILLFQDLALVPLLILVPALAQPQGNLTATLGWAALKAVIVLLLLFFVGKKLIRSWLSIVVKRRSQELFMLNLLLITLGAAWITEHAGLSLALGAFVAGMLISETEYRHQVEEDIKPFRDVLLGLFFITVGMLLNVRVVIENWWVVLLLLAIPLLLKFVLITALAKLFNASTGTAIRTGLGLAQAGEFGFVLLNQAGGLSLIEPMMVQCILAAMVLSMLIAPLILIKSDAIARKISHNDWMLQSLALTQIASRTMTVKKHVLIAGFGRSGQNLAQLLEAEKVNYYALDLDPERVQEAQIAGANVAYGDASRRESLLAAGIHRALAVVITYVDTPAALKTLHLLQELAPSLPVIIRSYDDSELEKLREAGATEVVPETLEGSLMLASHTLLMLGVPLRRVVQQVRLVREQRYASLRGYFYGSDDVPNEAEHLQMRLHSIVLTKQAHAAGKSLESLNLAATGAGISMIRRQKIRLEFNPATVLQEGDIVVLRGNPEQIALAEEKLLQK